ncbi:hypothetical protein Meth11DRAFT_1386 [Methylophilaceae bacterium 11]|nr:hypothetical protein Meth11DRAFT_1386 [Methylophilaceae bacterium 11]
MTEKNKVEFTESEQKDRDHFLGLAFVFASFVIARSLQHLLNIPLIWCGVLTTLAALVGASLLDKHKPFPNKHAWKMMAFVISLPVLFLMSMFN